MIADVLIEMAWKSSLVAAVVLLAMLTMRRNSPSDRVAVADLGFALLVLIPLAALTIAALPVPTIDLPAPSSAGAMPVVDLLSPAGTLPAAATPASSAAFEAAPVSGTPWTLLWLAGVLAVVARLAAGIVTLRAWRANAGPVASTAWLQAVRECDLPVGTRLLVSDNVSAPLSFGWRRPTILIGRDTLQLRGEAKAIIAHEAAHLARRDWLRLIGARLVVALFWFNPLVWLMERVMLQESEEAADAEAARLVEPHRYAQVLLNIASGTHAPAAANSIVAGTLARRIRKILSPQPGSISPKLRVAALAAVGLVAAPVAALELVEPSTPIAPARGVERLLVSTSIAAPVASSAPAVLKIATPVSVAVPKAPAMRTVYKTVAIAAATPVAAAVPVAAATEASDAVADSEQSAEEAAAQARMQAAQRKIEEASREIAESSEVIRRNAMARARVSMLHGADEMERGAVQMKQGAAQMRDEARKLRDPAYRAKVIAEARANADAGKWKGANWSYKVPTDQELIDAIPKMEDGARKMDAGVDDMRRNAKKMREEAQRQN